MRFASLFYLYLLFSGQCAQYTTSADNATVEPGILLPQQRFYRTGELLANYTMTPDSLMHGRYEEYFQDSTVHRRMEYRDGLLNGLYESFYPSGAIASRHIYEKGYPHGPYTWYHENGRITQQGEKVWGKTEGEVLLYHDDGELQARRNYIDDQLTGSAVEYYPNGQLQQFSYYDQDRQRVFAMTYEKDGRLLHVFGTPFADLKAQFNRLSGKFSLNFNLVVPPEEQPKVRLLRRQDKQTWLCPVRSNGDHYQFLEPLPDDYIGKYQLEVSYPRNQDTLHFSEEVFVNRNQVYFDDPVHLSLSGSGYQHEF